MFPGNEVLPRRALCPRNRFWKLMTSVMIFVAEGIGFLRRKGGMYIWLYLWH